MMQNKPKELPLSFINNISDCILIISPKKEIISVNKNAVKVLGIRRPGRKTCLIDKLIKEENQKLLALIDRTIKSKRSYNNIEITYKKRNKEIKLLFSSMVQKSGTVVYNIIIILQNITDLYLAHINNRKLQYQLRKNYINLLENLRQITESIAHEMRNPLSSIGGYTNFLLKKDEINKNNYAKKYLAYIGEDTERLLNIVKQAEEYSHIKEINFSKSDISTLLKKLISFARKYAKKKAINIELILHQHNKYEVYLDKKKLQIAMQDLIKNTVNLANKKSTIIISLQYKRYDIDFDIELKSDKINDENINFLFNPFYSISGDVINFNFATARRIIILHGGTIKVFKKISDHIAFEINIPREKRIV